MKLNRLIYILLILFISLFLTNNVFAATHYVTLVGDDVRVRKGPGTNYDKLGSVDLGATFDLIDTTVYKNEGGCSDGWHKIQYTPESVGYICKSYVRISEYVIVDEETKTNCEDEMKKAGFPASYWKGLCDLKAKHPTWNFEPVQTGLDWQYVITKESSCGKNLIQTSDASYIDATCKDGYGSWYPASKKAVAYYMDPRNFLTEKYIFQYEYLRYDSKLSNAYISSAASMLAGADFYKYHTGKGNNLSTIINEAGKNKDVNPVHISARMKQELGNGTSLYNLYSGEYTGHDGAYKGYYNFFNIGVSDSCATTNGTSYCGLSYAKSKEWNTPLKAIEGGAQLLGNSYIAKGQYNMYLQKFNVVPTDVSKLFIHQYMTNIKAPSSESSSTYSTYNKLNLLSTGFTFKIPVYTNMDNTIDNSGSGASKEEEKEENKYSALSIPTIVTEAGYKIKNSYLTGVKLKMNVNDLKNDIEGISGKDTVTVFDEKGKTYTGIVKTGIKVSIINKEGTTDLTIIVKGDTSGDGAINALDLLQVQKTILNVYDMSEYQEQAADTSGDGKINALDLLQVQKYILNVYEIKQ